MCHVGYLTVECRGQAADYRRRAACMADARFLGYSDFETVLLAPAEFIVRHGDCVSQFDRSIGYEQVAEFAPLFGTALTPASGLGAPQ